MRLNSVLAVGIALLLPAVSYGTGDAEAGAGKAGLCIGCHGPAGISMNPMWPNLAGQHAYYLEKQMKAFRDGLRKDPVMQAFVGGLSDGDIADLAAHFSSLPPG